jgi:tRNA pseudouridine38-40 synthase
MSLWKTTLTYDGTPYHGWQVQPGLPTIQGTLAQAIQHVTGENVLPQGSGRTDTGVHALAQVASFPLTVPIPAPNLHRALNQVLPPSIRILTVEQAPEDFHARHSVLRKTYEYRIFSPADQKICSPMLAPFVWAYRLPLDFDLLQDSASRVIGSHDFTSFAACDPDLSTRSLEAAPAPRSNVRTIFHSTWHRSEDLVIYRVTGSGFLHHMVRNLVGTFVDAASRPGIAPDIPGILAARNRSAAGATAPARGLFLAEVEY